MTLDIRAVLDDLKRRIAELQTAHDVLARLIEPENPLPAAPRCIKKVTATLGGPPPATASGRKLPKPSKKQSKLAPEVPRIRKLALENYELSIGQLKEKFNVVASTETIRQIVLGKIYPDADYDPKEWIDLHKGA